MQHARTVGAALALLLAAAAVPALASAGDESHEFRLCTTHCLQTGCTPAPGTASSGNAGDRKQRCSSVCAARGGGAAAAAAASVSPALRFWRWTCAADCSYLCMWQLEGAATGRRGVWKYHGKWPFARWGGMQEPASVAFSLANLAVHAAGLSRFLALRRLLLRGGRSAAAGSGSGDAPAAAAAAAAYPWAWAVAVGGGLSMNAWLWSAVFHGRDTRVTERLDYLSADALIAFNLFFTLSRTAGLRSRVHLAALGTAIALALLRHAHHMLFVLFDYGLNVRLCIAAGAVQSMAWLAWAARGAPPGHRGRPPLAAFVVLLNACMALEVLDFPPIWRVFDAHSLWHLATVAITPLWYRFAAADLTDWAGGAAVAAHKGN